MSATHCDVHNHEWKMIPAGVSKTTGKPYNSFQACPERGCREKPQKAQLAAQVVNPVAGPLLLKELEKQTKILEAILTALKPQNAPKAASKPEGWEDTQISTEEVPF